MEDKAASTPNPLQRARAEQTAAQAARTTAWEAQIAELKAQCSEQLACIDTIVAWARRYNLGQQAFGSQIFEMEPMHIPGENGKIDRLTEYRLVIILNQNRMLWGYKSGPSFSNVSYSIHEDETSFWTALRRATPQMFLDALEKTAQRCRVPMPV